MAIAAATAAALAEGVEFGVSSISTASNTAQSAWAKKKKKKSVVALGAPSRLCPGGCDTILQFLHPEKHGDIFVPRRFAEPDTGPPALIAELVRLFGTLVKVCTPFVALF